MYLLRMLKGNVVAWFGLLAFDWLWSFYNYLPCHIYCLPFQMSFFFTRNCFMVYFYIWYVSSIVFLICFSIMIFVRNTIFSWYHIVGYQKCFQHYPRCELSCKPSKWYLEIPVWHLPLFFHYSNILWTTSSVFVFVMNINSL